LAHRVRGDGETALGEERLQHRGEQRHVVLALLAHRLVGVALGEVAVQGGPEQEGAAGLEHGAGVHQHAAHVGVDEDRVGRTVGVLRAGERAALQPVAGELGGGLVGGLALSQALHADAEPLLVHHHEHDLQTAVLLADQPAGRLLVAHHAGGVAVDAHLLLEAEAFDTVALARFAFGVRQELRHDEEADAAHAGRRAFDAGQHQMDDVGRQVVLAGRDPDLLA